MNDPIPGLLRPTAALWGVALLLTAAALLLGRGLPTEEWALDPVIYAIRAVLLLDTRRDLTVRLTQPTVDGISPAWSPDGAQLAYMTIGLSEQQVIVIDAHGGNQRVRFSGPPGDANSGSIAWSPDGTHLAFTGLLDGRQVIYLDDLDSPDAPQPLTGAFTNALWPTFSADGRELAFSWAPAANQEIFVAELGSVVMPISSDTQLTRVTHDYNLDSFPAWSPDGRWLAFTSDRQGNSEIYVVPAACLSSPDPCDARMKRLTDHIARDILPTWSPDGKRLLFTSNRTGIWQVYVLDAKCLREGPVCPPVPLMDSTYQNMHVAIRP
ncbi:MAG: PD40 domain-containing protein [Anaerolineae bacterium]|nr:PD40 domain-containing protein [Anaerolineae bacterium]